MDKKIRKQYDKLLIKRGKEAEFKRLFFPSLINITATINEDGQTATCDITLEDFIDRGIIKSEAFEHYSKTDFCELFADELKESYQAACVAAVNKAVEEQNSEVE